MLLESDLNYEGLTIFNDIKSEAAIRNICLCAHASDDEIDSLSGNVSEAFNYIVTYCEERGLGGDLWADYLTDLLVNSENVYSKACEAGGDVTGSKLKLALHDMGILHKLISIDIAGVLCSFNMEYLSCVTDYVSGGEGEIYGAGTAERICDLADRLKNADSEEDILELLSDFYKKYGTGRLGLHGVFKINSDESSYTIEPIPRMPDFRLSDLIGYEIPKRKLIENTEAFIAGRPANNCLLYGDAGTGKSSSIRAIATEYYDEGLRIIQVHREQFKWLNDIISEIRYRGYRFIIYMDDLSFEDFETDYKYLKAIIEGGLEKRPDNVLIYATSNRRHLIRENSSDRNDRDEDMHRSDTMAEKLSLSQRFGVSIFFGKPDKKEFNEIVVALADREGLKLPREELLMEANKWELSHGGLSGRTARQFIDYLLGKSELSAERSDT